MSKIAELLITNPRLRVLRPGAPDPDGRCVVYWMQRAQRGRDNPALNLAIDLGNALKRPVVAAFGLTADYPSAQRRHCRFLLDGLRDAEADLTARGVPLIVRLGSPPAVAAEVAREAGAAIVVGDENPVRIGQKWRETLAGRLKVPFVCVDADVVVPTSLFPKEEYAARTIRPKIHKIRDEYLTPIPNPKARVRWPDGDGLPRGEPIEPARLLERLRVGGASEVPGYLGGTVEALRRLRRFVRERLPNYADGRNRAETYWTSELSAHLHFGHIGPTTIALAVRDSGAPRADVDAYLEELIVRRELAVNFVARNPDYDRLAGCPEWALKTLAKHAHDRRPILVPFDRLKAGDTHDPLWNAAQFEMLKTGRMHGYLRMYWAKKVLEWTHDPEAAFEILVRLNDTYFMDGRNPNGYAGVAWAVGGKHDRPWPERPIFGTVRFMSYDGIRRKIDAEAYMEWVAALK